MPSANWLEKEPPAIQSCVGAVIRRMGGLCADEKCEHCPGLVESIETLVMAVRLDAMGRDAGLAIKKAS